MVRFDNYITIQGWMVKDLGLKGNELLIYAIINGFSQDQESQFKGSLSYLAEWTNSTKQGVIKALNSLVDKGLIVKQSLMVNKVYYSTKFNVSGKQSLILDGKQSLTPTNNTNIDNINYNNKEIYKEICDYLNQKTNSNYRSTTASTQRLIKARLNDGFTVEDFKKVIDIKCSKWLNDEKMKVYLRPETLFGTKFESYLNEKVKESSNDEVRKEERLGIWL